MPEVVRDGVRIHYRVSGSGPPVLWHTGGCGDGSMWCTAGYLERLPGCRHLLLDHRGHGLSDRPTALSDHAMEQYLADMLAVLDHAGVERAALVGYSDGARLVYALAARHPERAAVVVGLGGVANPGETSAWRRRMAAEVRQVGCAAWLQRMSLGESEVTPAWLMANLVATPTEMFALEVEGWAGSPSECADFPRIQAPTLVVCGERENPDGSAELAVAALPRGSSAVLLGLGHLQTFWRSDLTGPLVAEFLLRQPPWSPPTGAAGSRPG